MQCFLSSNLLSVLCVLSRFSSCFAHFGGGVGMIAKLRLNAKCDKLHDVYMMLVTTSIYLPCS